MLKACLNGPRATQVPLTAGEIALAAASAVAVGADALHVHPKGPDGQDSLAPADVDAVVAALRAAVPGVPVGVTTGAWASPDPAARVEQVAAWTVLPDFASVNWHEDGCEEVAAALLERGIGVEAGVWYPDAASRFVASPLASRCLRVLLETTEDDADAALATAAELLELVRPLGLPILLHGEGAGAWPVHAYAVAQGLDRRIGLEDVQLLPDGSPAPDNTALVAAARLLSFVE